MPPSPCLGILAEGCDQEGHASAAHGLGETVQAQQSPLNGLGTVGSSFRMLCRHQWGMVRPFTEWLLHNQSRQYLNSYFILTILGGEHNEFHLTVQETEAQRG